MMTLLPWLLIFVLDGKFDAETKMRFASHEECMARGELLSLSIRVDLQLTNHVVTPKCVERL
jgi:hypothetical protein